MNWLKSYWWFLTALAGMSAAWGQQQLKVEKLEDAVVQQAAINRELKETREQSIRQDEKLKSIERSQQTTEQLLRDLLQGQREIARKVR